MEDLVHKTTEPELPAYKEDSLRFACPFFKLDRVKHHNCLRFQLKRVKDVKQHISRKHAFHCTNCFEVFPDSRSCETHMSHLACQADSWPQEIAVQESISDAQKQMFSLRATGLTETDKWFAVWSILFPDSSPPPSPYLAGDMDEVVLTALHLFNTNSGQIFRSLERNVSRETQIGTSGNIAQRFFAHTTDEERTTLVRSIFYELSALGAPGPGVRSGPSSGPAVRTSRTAQAFDTMLNDLPTTTTSGTWMPYRTSNGATNASGAAPPSIPVSADLLPLSLYEPGLPHQPVVECLEADPWLTAEFLSAGWPDQSTEQDFSFEFLGDNHAISRDRSS